MSKKRTTEQNRLKAVRYRLRKRVASLEQEVEEQEQRLNSIKESGSPEDIERVERNVVFAKKNAELFSQYKVENTLTREQYNQKKSELRESLFTNEIKKSKSIAARKYYYKNRYGSDWQQVMNEEKPTPLNIPFKSGTNEYKREWCRIKKEDGRQLEIKMFNEKPAPLNIPFKSNTNEYKRERYRLKKEEQQEMEAEMLKVNPNFKREFYFISHRIRNKRKFYDNHKSVVEIPKHLTRYEMYMSKNGYTDFFDLPQEIKSQLRQWDRLDIAERFALHIIAVYVGIIRELKLDKTPHYNLFEFLPPHMEITDQETAYEKLGEQGFYEFRWFVHNQLNKAVEKYKAEKAVEEPAEK